MKVLFITNIPSPYRVAFYDELGKHCELTVLFERTGSSERDASWKNFSFQNFNGIVMRGIKVRVDMAFCPQVTKYIDNSFDHIVCTDFLSPTGMYAISCMRRKKIKYCLESDGGFERNDGGFKKRLKTKFIAGADAFFATCDEHERYYLHYGADRERMVRYPFSSVCEDQIIQKPVSPAQKQEYREKLGIREEKIVLTVGQFIHRKGFDVLLRAVRDCDSSVGVYFVGGRPTDEYIALKEDRPNIHFVGFQTPMQLADYYRAADIFVLPTREDIWGLVINEALAFGLPVITTERCLAGVEMIQSGENGYLVPADDSDALSAKIRELLSDEETRAIMAEKSLQTAHRYTIETMVDAHVRFFERH